MQILRQALLYKLSTSIILFKVIRNKILCLTQYQLILLSIDEGCRKTQIPYSGINVWAIEMSKDYIIILQRSGNLQIRRLDNINQVIFTQTNIKINNQKYPKLKWWEDDLHIVYQKRYDEISLSDKSFTSHTPPFEINQSQTLMQLEFCDLFPGLKTIFYIMTHSIHMCSNGIKLGLIQFQDQEIKQVLRLCHPLQGNEFKKQYLVLLTETVQQNQDTRKAMIKVYNILSMQEIFSRELYKQKDQFIEICSDELCEYLLVKYYRGKNSNINSIQSQYLMKVNGEYYYSGESDYSDRKESFFNFDIMIGLGKNLKLFPSHSEKINGKLCNSIDTCYYDRNQIFIASIILEASYKDQIFHTHQQLQLIDDPSTLQSSNHLYSLSIWKQLVEAKLTPKKLFDRIAQSISLRSSHKNQIENFFSIQIGMQQQKLIQILLLRLNQINHLNSQDFNKAYLTIKKIIATQYLQMLTNIVSIQNNQKQTEKSILQKSNEDFTNTMSGPSSSQTHSPRSIKSDLSQKYKEMILKDMQKDLSQTGKLEEESQFCAECKKIADHENLQLIQLIEEQSRAKTKQKLTRIEQQLEKMERLCRYRLERMEMKTRRDKKTEDKVVSLIESQFKSSLQAIKRNLIRQAEQFTVRLSSRSDLTFEKERKTREWILKVEDDRAKHENELNIHIQNKEELLDYLYDIQFPEVGVETYQPARNFNTTAHDSRFVDLGENGLSRASTQLETGKGQHQDFRLFSDFILKNFI